MKHAIKRRLLTLILLITFALPNKVAGQAVEASQPQKNNWRTLAGYAQYGGGDINGLSVMNEYNRYLTHHIRIAPNFKYSSAKFINTYKRGFNNTQDDFLATQANIYEIGTMGYYEYLNPNKSGLELGLGVFYRNLQYTISTGPYSTYESTKLNLGFSSVGQFSENTFGLNISIGFIIQISQVVGFNINGIVQSDTGDNTGFAALGGISIKF